MSFRRPLLVMTVLGALAGCAASEDDGVRDDESTGASAFTVDASDFKPIAKPDGFPDAWFQPPSEGAFGRFGKCGQTAAANLLRLHSIEEHPNKIFADGGRSVIGLTPNGMVRYLSQRAPSLQVQTANASAERPLGTIVSHLRARQAIALVTRYGRTEAHWFTVVGVRGLETSSPDLVVQEQGEYKTIRFDLVEENWRQVLTLGQYPYVVVVPPTDVPLFVE